MSIDYLERFDIDTLVELLLRSQQFRERKALCINIGIDHKRLNFIENTSDHDFFIHLTHYLNETGNNHAICCLCCKELLPTFSDQENRDCLQKIIEKLGCNQSNIDKYPTISLSKKRTFMFSSPFFLLGLIAICVPAYNQLGANTPNLNCTNSNHNSLQNQQGVEIKFMNLFDGMCADQLLNIQGEINVDKEIKQIWIVVKPLTDNNYYVQPPANINNGEFQAQIYIGEKDTTPGTKFEIRAFVEPNNQLSTAQKLDNWPEARWHSDIIRVTRK
ncbi:hypothetical protein Nos7524_3989 [Nostoc sp. PCC 7524]|uniref:hypothetical protein n=1 Tax=Nostoc sp. (strain ATCC 29411 / PCC 7524) TaxID=28072 RepID=UPI00029EFC60|nr:hypothetical protein [Nostoc sp. PCC 7524]AFY49762.1 hypothetical protein Nos7524_3989 [Nostoc sp. PCC 7524]